MKTAVVILNWNGRQFLEIFLKMVVERSVGADVIVADNGSSDDSLEYLRANFPAIRIIALKNNYGYTGGYNRVLQIIDNQYIILLNSDIEPAVNWLMPLEKLMDAQAQVVAIQPKILSFGDKTRFEYAGASGGFIDALGYPFCRGRFIGNTCEVDSGQYNDARECFWATGAALMVRRKAFLELGGFDDHFFAHMEEIDLCWRFKRAGWKVMVEPASCVYHVGGGTLPVWSPKKTYLNFRNNIAMLYKNLSILKFTIVYTVRLATDFLRLFSYFVVGKMNFAAAIFRGHRDFWRMRSSLDRQNILRHKPVGQIFKGSIILRQLFISKKFNRMMSLILLLTLTLSCTTPAPKVTVTKAISPQLINSVIPSYNDYIKLGDTVTISYKQAVETDSVAIYFGGKKINNQSIKTTKIGRNNFYIVGFKDGDSQRINSFFTVLPNTAPKRENVQILKTINHQKDAYTQGLTIKDGVMYESTGQYGSSSLRALDMATGKILRQKKLADDYFGEGLTILNGELYLLTWENQKGFIYNLDDFTASGEFAYTGEGWGLTTDGELLYLSNGSGQIVVYKPENFTKKRVIEVYDNKGKVEMLNELEWIGGKIWANIYMSNTIAVIDPESGVVEKYIDCTFLEHSIGNPHTADVLNGIALDPATGHIYVTGKLWDKMFQIR
ncbi:MAG: glutaminyl-peptide cyclotransferase [Mucinivorans sp.]